MKNASIILNIVLTLSVAILYYLHFSKDTATKDPKEVPTEEQEKVSETPKKVVSNIGYLNTDTLRSQYKLYDELIAKLSRREKKYEKELNAKSASFEKEVMDFQQKAPQMTQFEGQMKQKELAEKEKELYELQERFTVKFQQEQAKLDEEFQEKVNSFIKKYNKDAKYELIIGASKMGNIVLDYNEGLNITHEIIEGLNKQYNLEKAPKEIQE